MSDEIKKTSTEIEYFESLLKKRIADWSQEELEAYGDKVYVRDEEKDLRDKEKDLRDEKKRLLAEKKSIHDVLRDKLGGPSLRTIPPLSTGFVSSRCHRSIYC